MSYPSVTLSIDSVEWSCWFYCFHCSLMPKRKSCGNIGHFCHLVFSDLDERRVCLLKVFTAESFVFFFTNSVFTQRFLIFQILKLSLLPAKTVAARSTKKNVIAVACVAVNSFGFRFFVFAKVQLLALELEKNLSKWCPRFSIWVSNVGIVPVLLN